MRAATTDDSEAIESLEMLLFPGVNFNMKTISNTIEDGSGLVEYNGTELVGYLLLSTDGGLGDIVRLGVHPKYQGCGIGTMFVKHTLKDGPSMLCVKKDNPRARKLYQKLGFHVVAHLHSFWVMTTSSGA